MIEISLLLTVISVSVAGIFGFISARRGAKQDTRAEAVEMTTVIVKLENISAGIAEIRSDLASVKKTNEEYRERITKVEESTKQAHKRLDAHDKLLNPTAARNYEERGE